MVSRPPVLRWAPTVFRARRSIGAQYPYPVIGRLFLRRSGPTLPKEPRASVSSAPHAEEPVGPLRPVLLALTEPLSRAFGALGTQGPFVLGFLQPLLHLRHHGILERLRIHSLLLRYLGQGLAVSQLSHQAVGIHTQYLSGGIQSTPGTPPTSADAEIAAHVRAKWHHETLESLTIMYFHGKHNLSLYWKDRSRFVLPWTTSEISFETL